MLRHRSPARSTPSRAGHRGQQEQEELPAGPCLLEQHCPRSARAARRRSPRSQLPAGKNELLAKAFLEGQDSSLLWMFYHY